MITLPQVELGVLGPVQVRQYGLPVAIPGAKPRAILTMLGLHDGSVVAADALIELLWGDQPPRTAVKAMQTHISALRRALGDGFVLTEGAGWALSTAEVDATRYKVAARVGRDAIAAGDASQAVTRFDEALALWRGVPELPEGRRGDSEKTRWVEGHAALVEDRADALLATGRAAELIGELEAAIADSPLRERRWGHLMLALYRAGRQGEALGAFQRARSLLADQLGVDPGPDLRRLEAAIVAQDVSLELPVSHRHSAVTRAVTFLLTDIEGSTAAWEADAGAMAASLSRHDEIVEQVVTFRGGRLIKTRGEGDATFSVFDRPSGAAAAAIELQEAIRREPWPLAQPMRIRVALHTGEVEFRDGDYFGRAVNRAARLRSLAAGGQILCSGATAELVIDTLADDVVLADLGMRQLKNLARPEHVFELRLDAEESHAAAVDSPVERPSLPLVLSGSGPFVGRGRELERLLATWQTTQVAGSHAVLISGEPGVGKTRLAGEWSRQAYEQGAIVLYGRCDEDLGAPYQPFSEALRSLVPALGTNRLRGLRGVEALIPLVPELTEVLPELAAPPRADPDTERFALFDAVGALLDVAAASTPLILVLDDLHWAAKPTLLLLRHVLRFGEHARVQIVGTYRSTDLDRSHPLAAMLADLHRDGSVSRLALGGLDEDDVTTYVAEVGYDDEDLARALASVTGGNPFFLIEALRHVDESGGRWDPTTLPQGVREAVSRRLSRLPEETNAALATAAVVGSRFDLALVERVVGHDLVDAFDESAKAGIVIEEPGGRYRFNHAIVRQSLLTELASVRRMRLHQRIATTLESEPGADDELLAELAYHYFECAWAGNAVKAVDYCRRAADQAMGRLAYEGAADLYGKAVHALEDLDDELPDRDEQRAELLVARCEALLAAGDVVAAKGAVSQLLSAAGKSGRLAAWGACFDGQLSMLTDPERLDEIESALTEAAKSLAQFEDAAGEAKAHTVRAGALARLGRIGDAETALDQALTAARRAREHRRVNAVLAGAPLAALWGPNPVPRAGGRCLDVVRLLRITTGSPVVEATSTRCQGVLDAFRGRAAAGRQLIESARRSLTELGMRHALLEVDQFAGIVELVADAPLAAEPHLRRAYNGFRRMGLDADTAETAALLARSCLALDKDAEADELCAESERLAGHALKAAIAWRSVRAQLLSRGGQHDEARRMAEEAVAIAERTDLLVDHGDACLALATVLSAAGDAAGGRTAAERAANLYDLKGAAALSEKARGLIGASAPAPRAPEEVADPQPDNQCVQMLRRLETALAREDWGQIALMHAPDVAVESRRKVVGFTRADLPSNHWPSAARQLNEIAGAVQIRMTSVHAVRGERLALAPLQITYADTSPGAPNDDLLVLFGIDDEGRIALQIAFDVDDIDAAMTELESQHARFDALSVRPSLENCASRINDRLNALFANRNWDELGNLFDDDVSLADRRKGLRDEHSGRDAGVAALRAIADTGTSSLTPEMVAIRGNRLALVRILHQGRDTRTDAFHTETLTITEVSDDELIVRLVAFDVDDLPAAISELDKRYLDGEAAPHALTWSTVVAGFAALNRNELPAAAADDYVFVDHQLHHQTVGMSGLVKLVGVNSQLTPDSFMYFENVHRLTDLGVVVTLAMQASSSDGFDARWRVRQILTQEGGVGRRCEVFQESDLDAALARFDELSRPAARIENAASRVDAKFNGLFAGRRWDELTELWADDVTVEDRRQGLRREANYDHASGLAEVRAIADLGVQSMTSTVIAIRGERLALCRARYSGRDQRPEAFHTEVLRIVEIDAGQRCVATIAFDLDDLEDAIAELDERYAVGEAAMHARAWTVVAEGYAALNRHEMPPTTPDWSNVDRQRLAIMETGDAAAHLREVWGILPDFGIHVVAVHRLTDLGAVVTWFARGTSAQGFEVEHQGIGLLMVQDDLIKHFETFDEADLDAALAGFDELSRDTQLHNTASQVYERMQECFSARDWDSMAECMAPDVVQADRRRVVNAEERHDRRAAIAEARIVADFGARTVTMTTVAIRGDRLALIHAGFGGPDERSDAFRTESLVVTEIDTDDRVSAHIMFDPDDFDAAFAELDARYVAGEAAQHARAWSLIASSTVKFNRGEPSAVTPEWVNIDHRRGTAFAPGEMTSYVHAAWEQTPGIVTHIEAVHRLSDLGAVVVNMAHAVAHSSFAAEWRVVCIFTIQGDSINRFELFDEDDLDAALARFDELNHQSPRLANRATRQLAPIADAYNRRSVEDYLSCYSADAQYEDRRKLFRDSGPLDSRFVRSLLFTGPAGWRVNLEPVALRGDLLVLSRVVFVDADDADRPVTLEVLAVTDADRDGLARKLQLFDVDDIEAAFAELEARYLAGEAREYAHTWSAIVAASQAFNRREMFLTTPDWVNIDHRRVTAFEPGDMSDYVRATWDVATGVTHRVVSVHRSAKLGAVLTQMSTATSNDSFDAEWHEVVILTVDGDAVSRCEIYDEVDLGTAIARFDELDTPPPQLENAATRQNMALAAAFNRRDLEDFLGTFASDAQFGDRRRVLRYEGPLNAEFVRGLFTDESRCWRFEVEPIAIRGDRLSLCCHTYREGAEADRPVAVEAMNLTEIGDAGLATSCIVFDRSDIDAAFAELDARYVAGEAAPHAHTWSLITRSIAAFNNHDLPPTTFDLIDHRRVVGSGSSDLTETLQAAWEITQNIRAYIEVVHRLDDHGAVITHSLRGTTREGFEFEWRVIDVFAVVGDAITRCEMFDETALETALARFDDFDDG